MKQIKENEMRTSNGGTWYNIVCTGGSKHSYSNTTTFDYWWAKAIYQSHRSHRGNRRYNVYLYKDGNNLLMSSTC